ncbi:MAG TPA: Ig-like domain-containing protein, partial [Mycobacterium sp.]|nr:Ig-like domain-containing protein [Mycobacterium sp.]
MATVLSVGDIAIVQYNSATTDSFTFVFGRDVEAGTVVNFTDNGWLAAGGFRPGEGTVTYTAPGAITTGTTVTLSGLNLDDAGDQIIAYQGDPATPTILHVADLADGNNTVAGDATNDNTTALPPGFTLDVNAVAVGFDNAVYAGPNGGPPDELFPLINDPANWISSVSPSALYFYNDRPRIDLDSNNSTSFGEDYRANVISGGPGVAIADTDTDIDDFDDSTIFRAQIDIQGTDFGDLLSVAGSLPFGISASAFDSFNGILTLSGVASHSAYQTAIEQIRFSTTQPVGTHKTIAVSVYDGFEWSSEAYAFLTVSSAATPPVLDLDANNSNGGGSDYTATATGGGPGIPIADTDVSITDADSTTIQSARITIGINRQPDDLLSIAGTLPTGITASSYNSSTGVLTLSGSASLANYQTALRQVVYSTPDTTPFTGDRIITVTVNDGTFNSNTATTYMHVVAPANAPPVNTVPGAQSIAEDTTLPIAGVSVADVDGGTLTTTLSVSSGTLNVIAVPGVSGNGSASVTITGTAAQINVALAGLSYTGNLNFNGADTLTVETTDGTDTDTDTIAITVNPVNDAPVNTVPGAQIVAEDTALPIAGVSVADVDSSALTTTLSVSNGTINVIAGAGVSGNGTDSITITGTAAQINTALLGLSYIGNLNFNGADTLTVATTDATAIDINTIAITVNPVNDAPVNTVPSAQSVAEDTALPIAGVSVADVDGGTLTTTLSVSSGTLNVIAVPGVSGNGSASVTITGTAAQINAALAGLSYTGNPDFNGADTLTVATSDDGIATDTDTIAITVNPVNDAPALIVTANAGFVENASPVLLSPSVDLSDLDDTDLELAIVQITDGSFDDDGGDGDELTAGGLTNGTVTGITFAWDAAQHALVFNGTSSVANYQALLQTVGFQSTSNNPTDF